MVTNIWAPICSHPIDYLIGSIMPTMIVLIIIPMHFYTFIMWITAMIFSDISHHCGYNFKWTPFELIPFGQIELEHSLHHKLFNCNYSSFFKHWDIIFGTSRTKI